MKITRQDHDDLNATITLVVEKDDYSPTFNAELKKYKGTAHLKGFRKGKTPMSAIKKMYGKPLLAEVINKQIDEKLFGYLKDENIDILGSPIPSEDQKMVDFDVNDLSDYTFVFDIGKSPDVDVNGVKNEDSYSQYKIKVDDKLIDDEMEMSRKRLGENKDIEDSIEEDDVLTLKAFELDGEKRKEKGWETGFTVMVNQIADEKLKKEVLGKKLNDTFSFNIYELEKDSTPERVKKYLLNLDEEEEKEIGEQFEGVIEKVSRRFPAELDDAFFEKAFPEGDVKDEAAARAKIAESISKFYEQQTKSVLFREVMEELLVKNDVAIPDDFLKRWLALTNQNVSQQNIEDEYEPFTKNLKWSMIKNSLVKKYNLIVEPDELRAFVKKKIGNYMQQYGGGGMDLDPIVDQMLSNKEAIEKEYAEVEAEKLFEQIIKEVTIVENEVSQDEFREIVQQLNEKQNQ